MLQVVMADEAGLNTFQDMLDCSICQEEMKTARVLPCGHSSAISVWRSVYRILSGALTYPVLPAALTTK